MTRPNLEHLEFSVHSYIARLEDERDALASRVRELEVALQNIADGEECDAMRKARAALAPTQRDTP